MVVYGQSSFSLSRLARRLKVIAQAGPIPPVGENTSGTKRAPSTSRRRCSHSRLLLRSCFAYWLTRGACMADGVLRWKTLTSKSDRLKRSPQAQNPRALMSRRASCVVFAERRSCSLLSGCRGGSSATSSRLSSGLDQGKTVLACFYDLSKAFDRVWHKAFLQSSTILASTDRPTSTHGLKAT